MAFIAVGKHIQVSAMRLPWQDLCYIMCVDDYVDVLERAFDTGVEKVYDHKFESVEAR